MKNFVMTIRKRIILPIIAVAFAVLCVMGLAACGNESITEDDIINMGYKISVVFDYRGGTVNEKDKTQIRIKEGSKIPNPASGGNDLSLPVRNAYSFRRFCVAQTNADGSLKIGDDGYLVPGEPWNFNTVPTTDVTLCAEWWNSYKILLHYGENDELTKTTYISRNTNGDPGRLSNSAFSLSDYTVLDYYSDSAKTIPLDTTNITLTNELFEASEDKLSYHVYTKSLEGTYRVIRSANDLNGFAMSSSTNLYFDADVDMNDLYAAEKSFEFPAQYEGKIVGNGHKLSNYKAAQSSVGASDYYYGMFKDITVGAEISDITFDNVNLTVNFNNPNISQLNIGLFAGRINSGVKISNVRISGVMDYTVASGFNGFDHLTVGEFSGETQNGAEVTDSGIIADNVKIIGATVVLSADSAYAVYVRTVKVGNTVTLGDVYSLATVRDDGAYSALSNIAEINKRADGSYEIIRRRVNTVLATYYVTLTDKGNGSYTATVTEKNA